MKAIRRALHEASISVAEEKEKPKLSLEIMKAHLETDILDV